LICQIDQDDQLLICSDHHYVHVPPRLRDQAISLSPKYACDVGEWSRPNFELLLENLLCPLCEVSQLCLTIIEDSFPILRDPSLLRELLPSRLLPFL
jgi:hypothetical protein